MIVPRSKLVLWVALVVVPAALLGAFVPAAAGTSLALIGLLTVAALADALAGRNSLAGIGVHLPGIVRTSQNRELSLAVRIHNGRHQQRALRLALALPEGIHSPAEFIEVTLPVESEWSQLAWECRATRRGKFPLQTAHLEGSSPFGFWAVRGSVPATSEIRVYPNLLTERKNLAALFLHRGAFGLHAQRQIGKGREFEKLREYVPGDGFDEIHWKATARRGHPITKVFQIERTQEVYVIIDASRLSARIQPARAPEPGPEGEAPPGDVTMLERFVTAALVLGLAAEQQGDLFGLLTFSDTVGNFLRARNGRAHYNSCRDALYTITSKPVTPDLEELCTFIRLRLRRRALLVFLTALDDPVLAASFARNMPALCKQHLILVNMIQPPGIAPLFSHPEVSSPDELYRELGGHLQWQKLRELEKVLKRLGIRFSLLENEKLSAQLVSQYLDIKRRQLL